MANYSELLWQGETLSRYEDVEKDCNDYTELFDKELRRDNHMAFYLLATPQNSFIREQRYANLVLCDYTKRLGEKGSCLNPADCRNFNNLFRLLEEVVITYIQYCGLNEFDLHRRIRDENSFTDESMHEICSLVNALEVPGESDQTPYYMRLFMISEYLYEQIKQCQVKLPDMIIGIFKYQ